MMTKTCAAFNFSVEKLFKEYEKVYFWTFTFKSVPGDDQMAMEAWAMLHSRLRNNFPDMQGLRVCELHKNHGIHFHCLVNIRIPIDRMKRLAFGNGRLFGVNHYLDFGRLSVEVANLGAGAYLAKYLTKQYASDNNFWHRRRWGSMGGFDYVRVGQIAFESNTTRNRYKLFGNKQCGYVQMMMIHYASTLFGEVEDWPANYIHLVFRQNTNMRDFLREGKAWVNSVREQNHENLPTSDDMVSASCAA